MATPNKPKAALFDAIPREATLSNRVVREMEAMITQGGLTDGSRLPPERDLATQFGVSRTVIREAVAALSARGLLEVQAGSGTVVKRPSVESIAGLLSLSLAIGEAGSNTGTPQPSAEQIRETVRCLAVEAAGLAAELHTDEDVERLSRATRRFTDVPTPRPPSETSDGAVIQALAQAAHNPLLALLLESVFQMCDPRDQVRTAAQCRDALDPIRKSDVKAARRAMRDMFTDPAAPGAPKSGSKKEKKQAS